MNEARPAGALALIPTGLVVTLAAVLVFRISDRRAKDRVPLDWTTGY